MEHRKLGATQLDVGVIGLGTEYLHGKSQRTVISVVHEAIDAGVDYFDLVFAFPEYRDNFGAAFKGRRDRLIIAGHIGCAETDGQYRLSRDVKENEMLFLDLLSRLRTDYVDILMIQMVNAVESYDRVMKPGGLMDLAGRFKEEGKARFIGISGHNPPGVTRFIEDGEVDVLMFPVNLAWDFTPARREILQACEQRGIGVVGMKIFGGGRLFRRRASRSISPAQCVNYVLSQPGVSTVVPGVKNVRELSAALHFLEAADEAKEYDSIVRHFQEELKGNCIYCNHCLPCPAKIDIGRVLQMVDNAICEMSSEPESDRKVLRERRNFYYPGRIRARRLPFKDLSVEASKCTECGACIERCPFDVDVVFKMRQAAKLFR